MKIKLLDWRDEALSTEKGDSGYILKVGNVDLQMIALDLESRATKPIGLVAPFDLDHLAYTFSCMATVRDHFPDYAIYAPVPKWCAREAIKASRGAGFDHFIFQFVDPWSFVHQTIHDLVEGKVVHVAGGDPKVEGWTWSEEPLV